MRVQGILSSRSMNREMCGGSSKSGLVPRHGQISSGVRQNIGRGKMPMTCVVPVSNAYYNKVGKNLG